jgi:hypothetical protein
MTILINDLFNFFRVYTMMRNMFEIVFIPLRLKDSKAHKRRVPQRRLPFREEFDEMIVEYAEGFDLSRLHQLCASKVVAPRRATAPGPQSNCSLQWLN